MTVNELIKLLNELSDEDKKLKITLATGVPMVPTIESILVIDAFTGEKCVEIQHNAY